ncbi:ABC transporter permease [Clostridium sporogenes]|uniref:ABC transporter permease n=1 Tax=Clostridium sporogenes TaxID=1509 RepID=UPI003DA220DD
MNTLINLGIEPKDILRPFINNSLETALIPTLNSMLGMGIIFLPGMMTGQILSGTLPITAIMYQIAIMIAICTSVCATVFLSLNLGYKSLYNNRKQFL